MTLLEPQPRMMSKELRREVSASKEVVAELTLENRLLKKSGVGFWEDAA